MKKRIALLLILFPLWGFAQNPNYTAGAEYSGTSNAYVIFDKESKPVKIYADAMDAIHFCNNRPYSNQQINLYYKKLTDTTLWEPNNLMLLDNTYSPEPLTDKYLAVDTVCLIMQSNGILADRAYTLIRAEDCKKYADNFKLQVVKIPYYYRDKRSYDQVYKIKKQRIKK